MKGHIAILIGAILWIGCEGDPRPRRAPFPRFDPSQPFRLVSTQRETGSGSTPVELTFEERLRGLPSTAAEPVAVPSTSLRRVPLLWRLGGPLPQEFDQWTWAAGEELTLIVHTTRGQPDAMIYAEPFSDLGTRWPSRETNRFLRTVAPSLSSEGLDFFQAFPSTLVLGLSRETGLKTRVVKEALRRLETRTAGRGLGFEPLSDTFTGWRWIGRNDQDIELRFARILGQWGQQDPFDETTRKVLDALAVHSVEMASLRDKLEFSEVSSPTSSSAWMVLGSAVLPPGQGVHVAIVCRQIPECPVSDALAGFLSGLERIDAGLLATARRSTPSDLRLLADRVALQLESRPLEKKDLAALAEVFSEATPQSPPGLPPGSEVTAPEAPPSEDAVLVTEPSDPGATPNQP